MARRVLNTRPATLGPCRRRFGNAMVGVMPLNMSPKMIENQTNWAGNYTYCAARWHWPETVEQVQELVIRRSKPKVLGTRHSFNGIADSPEDLISLEHFGQVMALDRERRTVTVAASVRYGQLCRNLNREGYALPNLASLPHISVAGACATATHGSGDHRASGKTPGE